MMKDVRPEIKIAFVGPHVSVLPEESLEPHRRSTLSPGKNSTIRWPNLPGGRRWKRSQASVSGRMAAWFTIPIGRQSKISTNFPSVVEIFKRDLDFKKYTIPYLLYPYVSFYTSRGCPALALFAYGPRR